MNLLCGTQADANTAIVSDDEAGMHASEKIISDTDADAIESGALSTPHRTTNAALVAADKEGTRRPQEMTLSFSFLADFS